MVKRITIVHEDLRITRAIKRIADILVCLTRPVEDGVYAYIDTPAPTTCTLADEWYFLEGGFQNEILESWELVPPLTYLGYNGTDGHLFEITVNASFSSDTGLNLIKMALFKNNTLQTNSIMTNHIQTIAQERPMSTVDVISFNIGDTVDIRISASQGGSQVTAVNLTTSLKRFFNSGGR